MAISILNQTVTTRQAPLATTETYSHTVGSGSNKLLLVMITGQPEEVGVTFSLVWDAAGANESLTEIGSGHVDANDALAHAFYLVNPTSATSNITVTMNTTWSSPATISVIAYTLTGVDQSSPIRDEDGDAGASDVFSATVTTVVDDFLAIAAIQESTATSVDFDDSTFTVTLLQDQVEIGGDATYHSGYGTADAASETGTFTSTSADHTALQLVAVAPTASSSSSSSSRSSSSSSSSSSLSSSSSSSSKSSSSSSSSSSSKSSSSSSSSSSSAVCGTVTWGHHTGVEEDYDEDFTGNTTGWDIGGTPGNDNENIDATACNEIILFERWCLGAGEAEILIDKYGTGYGPAPVIQYRTAITGLGVLVASWVTYNGVSFTSLGWVQIRLIHI